MTPVPSGAASTLSRYRNMWGAAVGVVLMIAAVGGVVVWHFRPHPSPQGAAPSPCAAGEEATPSAVLVLTSAGHQPRVSVHVGDVVELSFPDWQGQPLRSPTQKPGLTCALGPAPGGPSSTLLVRALHPGTVRFYSGLAPYSGVTPRSGTTDSGAGAAASILIGGIVVIR